MGNSWHNSRWLRKFFGNPLKSEHNWESYVRILHSRMRRSAGLRAELEDIVASGRFSARYYARKSGFAVLQVDDRAVEVRIYIDGSGVPAQTLTVLENK